MKSSDVMMPSVGLERKYSRGGRVGEKLLLPGLKKPIAAIARRSLNRDIGVDDSPAGNLMERLEFEPFGERLAPDNGARKGGRASKWLLWTGSAVFWSLAAGIVLARAAFFDPSVFASFQQVAALTRSIAGF